MVKERTRPYHVLVADASPHVGRCVVDEIEKHPLPTVCTIANDGPDCLATLKTGHVDIAFIDIQMATLAGIQALARTRNAGNAPLLVMMSTKPGPEVATLVGDMNVYDVLAKPLAAERIQPILANYAFMKSPTTLLLVDDSALTRQIIKRVLRETRFTLRVDEASSGEEALSRYDAVGHDVILLDINMPGIDGIETLSRLRSLNPNVRFVLATADRNRSIPEYLRMEAGDRLLYKPFFPSDVDKVLHGAFGLTMPSFDEPVEDAVYI